MFEGKAARSRRLLCIRIPIDTLHSPDLLFDELAAAWHT